MASPPMSCAGSLLWESSHPGADGRFTSGDVRRISMVSGIAAAGAMHLHSASRGGLGGSAPLVHVLNPAASAAAICASTA